MAAADLAHPTRRHIMEELRKSITKINEEHFSKMMTIFSENQKQMNKLFEKCFAVINDGAGDAHCHEDPHLSAPAQSENADPDDAADVLSGLQLVEDENGLNADSDEMDVVVLEEDIESAEPKHRHIHKIAPELFDENPKKNSDILLEVKKVGSSHEWGTDCTVDDSSVHDTCKVDLEGSDLVYDSRIVLTFGAFPRVKLKFDVLFANKITTGLSQCQPFASRSLSFTATSNVGDIQYSYRFFLQLSLPTIFNYNLIIRGFSNSRNPNKAICVFVDMLRNGVNPDYLTYPFLVKASARLSEFRLGLAVHCPIVKTGYVSDKFVCNSLIHMYGSCGNVVSARKVFDELIEKNQVSWNSMLDGYAKCGDVVSAREVFELMPERDVVSWSSLIDGYVKDGEFGEALAIFDRMQVVGCLANEVTMVSVLCACARMGALEKGRTMNRYIIENRLPLTLVLRTSLVDMYAKCGAIEDALDVFGGVSFKHTDVLIWNAIIGGLATHGFVNEAFDMFTKMKIVGITPDEITYLCMLNACAHGGLVKEAWCFFEFLGKDGFKPKTEHYACMVDVLARAGQVVEAYQFLCQMPMQPTPSMLGALLSGCINNRKLDLAEIVGKWLIQLEPDHDGRYVGLSNVYAVIKRWEEAKIMREAMERRGVKKSPGYSFVEIFGTLHKFIAHDKTHAMSEQIYMMLSILLEQMISSADSMKDASLCGEEYDLEA